MLPLRFIILHKVTQQRFYQNADSARQALEQHIAETERVLGFTLMESLRKIYISKLAITVTNSAEPYQDAEGILK